MSTGKRLRLRVTGEAVGLRLDQALARLAPELSRAEARRLIARGSVFLAGSRVKVASRIVQSEQALEVHLGQPISPSARTTVPPHIPVLLSTPDLVVVDKPSGLLCAPTPETDQADLLHFLKPSLGELYLVHRLDAPTSGALLLARTSAAARALSEQLQTRALGRKYVAFLAGTVAGDFSMAEAIDGRAAETHFRVTDRAPQATRVEAELSTGRTHQIRIHAKAAGHPVLGDRKHGRPAPGAPPSSVPRAPRLALHAASLRFVDPASAEEVEVQAPFPPELAAYWASLC